MRLRLTWRLFPMPRRSMLRKIGSPASAHADRLLLAMKSASEPLLNFDACRTSDVLALFQPGPELREAVCAYVAHLKGAGCSPQQVLVAVKQCLVQFERLPEVRRLTDAVISLCIEAFYKA